MSPVQDVRNWRPFFIRIILPCCFAVTLFVIGIFFLIIPSLEKSMMHGKKEMIKELTFAALSIVHEAAKLEQQGMVTRQEAQEQALQNVQFLRYGDEIKDYFWVMDLSPKMLMHPYRSDLIGKDLQSFRNREGRNLFVEFARLAQTQSDGYVRYMWEDKDDASLTVPKLSYVKLFEPWGWIIGTGIYLDDVRVGINTFTQRLLAISLGITVILSALLFFITRESMKIEASRQENEARLREAGEKYKKLVEASTEGVLMVVDSSIVFVNRILEDISGFEEQDILGKPFTEFIAKTMPSARDLLRLTQNSLPEEQINLEALFTHKTGNSFDTLLSLSPIEISGQKGMILIVKDISTQKQIAGELGARHEKFEHLTDNISIGVFRTTYGNDEIIVEANQATADLFGIEHGKDILTLRLQDLFNDPSQYHLFMHTLKQSGSVKNMVLDHRKKGGGYATLSITAVTVKKANGQLAYCDGFVEDITERHRREQEREGLINELQASLLFQNEPIHKAHSVAIPSCQLSTPIALACRFMVHAGASAILVEDEQGGRPLGIVTDNDIRERVIAKDLDTQKPVSSIMSAPLIGISTDALVFEGIVKMLENNVDHLLLRDTKGDYMKVISAKNLLKNQQYILTKLISDIEKVESPLQLSALKDRLPTLVQRLFESAPDTRNLTRIISAVAEAVMKKCVSLAIKELGEPPCGFAFMAMGSVGREEQTLVTDQDNAIIFEQGSAELSKERAAYFLEMGEKVCNWLDDAGYALCIGDIMAKNPKWCQPIDVWKDYFNTWVSALEPTDLLDSKIFFDFRWVYGDVQLVDTLRDYLHELTANKPIFLYHLAQNCLQSKPPLNMFKNIVVESSGEHREKFSIKRAMTPLVDYTRIYALRYGIRQTNTFSRINQLHARGHLSVEERQELIMVYKYLLELRFKHQIHALADGKKPDNHINPKRVTAMEQVLLREALSQVVDFQTKMSFDFNQL